MEILRKASPQSEWDLPNDRTRWSLEQHRRHRRNLRLLELVRRALQVPAVSKAILEAIEELLAPKVIDAVTETVLGMQRKGILTTPRRRGADADSSNGG